MQPGVNGVPAWSHLCREREVLARSNSTASSSADGAREENGSGHVGGAADARSTDGDAPSSPWPPEGSHASRPLLASKSGRWDGERERCAPLTCRRRL